MTASPRAIGFPASVHVRIDAPFRRPGRIGLARRAARAARRAAAANAAAANAACPQNQPVELTVVLSDDQRLRELNARFRGIDRPTDVLSFAGHGGLPGASGEAPLKGALPAYLGDVVISMDRCAAQARAQGHSPEAELALLVIHGTLHLLGYDHNTRAAKARMWAAQDAALRSMGLQASPTEM